MANQSARELLSRLPVFMADGGDPSLYAGSEWASQIESEAMRRARETGTVDQYYANLLATEQRILDEMAEDPGSWDAATAYNAIIESGVSIKDALDAGVKQSTIDAIFASGAPLTAAQLGGTTGSAFAGEGRLAGVDRAQYASEAQRKLAEFMADDYLSPEERRYAQQVATTQGLSLADIASVGIDPNILFNIPEPTPEPAPAPVAPAQPTVGAEQFPQTQAPYTAPEVYQPLPDNTSVFAPGQPSLDVAFRESAPRTEVTEDVMGTPQLTGFDYAPAASLISATGSGFSWTPPTVTSRPRSLLSTEDLRRYNQGRAAQDMRQLVGGNEEAYRAFEPLLSQTGSYSGGLSRSQLYALMSQQASQQPQQEAANYAQYGTRFGAPPAGTAEGYSGVTENLQSITDPMRITPVDFRYDTFAEGGLVKKPEGYADGGSVPGTDVDLLQQQLLELDRQAMEQELRARQEAPSAEDQATRTESRTMLQNILGGAREIPTTVYNYGRDIAASESPLRELGSDVASLGRGMYEGAKEDPLGFALDMTPIVGEVRSALDAEKYSQLANEAEAAGDHELARILRQVVTMSAAGTVPLAGAGARGAKRAAKAAADQALAKAGKGAAKQMLEELTPTAEAIAPPRAADDIEPPDLPESESARMLNELDQATTTTDSKFQSPPDRVAGSSVTYRADDDALAGVQQRIKGIAAARQNKPNALVTIDDIAQFHQQDHVNRFGRQLDQFNDEDFNLGVNAAADEVRYQLGQAVTGKGWYDNDVRKTFEIASQIPGLESLATSETDRVILSALLAPTSIGQKVSNNTRAAIAAMLGYKRTGQVPITPPAKGAVTEGIPNAGWGFKQGATASGMRVINHLLNKFGPDGFADWWLSPHSLKELTELRKEAGLSGAPTGLSGGSKSMHLGAMILGDKTGRFSLNINGYEGTTKDVWFTRSYNRYFGNMYNAQGEVAGAPRSLPERRRMEEFTRNLQEQLKDEGLSEQDIQAILWYYEQNLMTDLGVPSRPQAFSQEAEKIYGNLRPAIRKGNAAQTTTQPAGLEGFRGISGGVRAIRDFRRADARRNNGSDIGGATGPYSREVIDADGGDGLLNFVPDPVVQRQYEAAGNSLPAIKQVDAASSAEAYNADMASAMSGRSTGAQVEIKSAEDLSGYNLFRTEAGSGFAIKPDGDIVAVFASPNEPARGSYAMLQAAVQAGGKKLDAFDTYLPKIYESVGFRPVARLPWNDEFAPPNWDKNTFREYNNGEPDIVFFVHDPEYFGGATDVPVVTDYDDAVRLQDEALMGRGAGQAPGAELTLVESITPEQREAWRNANKGDFRQTQTPELADAARDLDAGKISIEDYAQKVKELRPIELITEVPKISSFEEMAYALDKNKVEKGLIGLNKEIPDGTLVGSRLDIPAYNNYDTWVVSVHEGTGVSGKSMGYGKVAVLDDVKFNSNPDAALGVATGKKDKAPFARMNGKWRNMDVEEARSLAEKYLNDPEWTQVGMNPYRHSFFYDKNTGMPVDTAEQVIQIGPLVLAKKATTRPLRSPEHMLRGSTAENPKYFKHGGNVERMTNDNRKYI